VRLVSREGNQRWGRVSREGNQRWGRLEVVFVGLEPKRLDIEDSKLAFLISRGVLSTSPC